MHDPSPFSVALLDSGFAPSVISLRLKKYRWATLNSTLPVGK